MRRLPRVICACTGAPQWRKCRLQGEFIVPKSRVVLCLGVTDGRIVQGVALVSLPGAGLPVWLAARGT